MILSKSDRRTLDRAWNCRLTTRGRKSGEPRRVTIWFAFDGDDLVLAGGPDGPHWCRNIQACPEVTLDIAGLRMRGRAHVVKDDAEAETIRRRFVERYVAARLSRPFGGYTRSIAVRVALDALAPQDAAAYPAAPRAAP